MNKSYRQGQILKVIRAQRIATQEELARELGKLGVDTSQVTLSRDIRELGLLKTPEGYRQVVAEATGPDLASVASESLWDVRVAQNMVVLRTSPGHANPLAIALDQSGWAEVVGTIAGDDTVLVVALDAATADELRRKMLAFLGVR